MMAHCRLVEKISEGGMGLVLEAFSATPDRLAR
jgi:hypothetical protein